MLKRPGKIALLALLALAAQGAQAQTDLTLNDGSANMTTISGLNDQVRNVTISGRTLYKDGDWNTLCLPFGVSAEQIALSTNPLHGATIKELDGTNSSLDDAGKLTLEFTTASAITAGKPYIVKWPVSAPVLVISSDAKWDEFVTNVSKGTSYSGQTVKLAADINISTGDMVGSQSNAFMGTFDGCGHTINCDIDQTGTGEGYYGVAPFFYINGATIKNVKVTGTVKAAEKHCAGLVGYAAGTCTIQNCWVDAAVTCTSGAFCGGVLGHAQTSTTTISNCLYSGTITGSGSTAVGVICGWSDDGSTIRVNNCLADGSYTSTGTPELWKGNSKNAKVSSSIMRNSETASTLVSTLGASNWYVSDTKALPKISDDIINPTFNGVTIVSADPDLSAVAFTGGKFVGTYNPFVLNSDYRSKILLLSSGNKLGYAKTDRTLNSFRAYFEINDGASVRSFELDFGDEGDETTGIIDIEHGTRNMEHSADTWYTIDGRRLSGQPSRSGIYVNNGRKVVIK